ncbi:DUF6257 family protein [Streptomyces sp. NPDC050164]|uniref:DUF6257 family protein n=1 Tax=Streptomyces sp. NPDC050164 TaxID=3365605 RepID=UPI0037910067
MAGDIKFSDLTLSEKAAVIRAEARGVRRATAGIEHQPDIDRKVAAVYERARKRIAKGK